MTQQANPDSLFLPVGVLMERRPAASRWVDHVWRAVEVLEEAPEVPDWTKLREQDGSTLFFAGRAAVALHPTDTSNYKHNLEAATPLVWVVLRQAADEIGWRLHGVTVDPGEAHVHGDVGNDMVEALPMPPGLRAVTADFVARHHKEHQFYKRKRDQADPQALARRSRLEDEE